MSEERDTPQQGRLPDEEGIPDLDQAVDEKRRTGDAQEGMIPPDDEPRAAEDFGTTAVEQRRGRSQDDKLWREEDEDDARRPGDPSAGRLVEDKVRGRDVTKEMRARDSGDHGGESAEEDAVRERDL